MKRKHVIYLMSFALFGVVGWFGLGLVSRAGYETAEYQVVKSDGDFEIRSYPELTVVSTASSRDLRGNDGGFMRLFRYISGQNKQNEKVAMTTPVLMDQASGAPASKEDGTADPGRMAFVLPRDVAAKGAPDPAGDGVSIRVRKAGQFAVVRFAGKLNAETSSRQESRLRAWLKERGLKSEGNAEYAGYDPPMTPSALRRNEVLLRLVDGASEDAAVAATPEKNVVPE